MKVAISLPLTLLFLITSSVLARQKPERHYGCPPAKNVCIYPIDDAEFQCNTVFDFQVELNVPNTTTIDNIRNELKISLKLPPGAIQETITPDELFKKEANEREWQLEAFEDMADENPDGFTSYALVWRNVIIRETIIGKMGGPIEITVEARGVTTKVLWTVREATPRVAKNVALFIGDGMSLPMMAAARLVSRGMTHGKYKDYLFSEKLDHFGLVNPAGVDSIITDSANSASSYNTGFKSSVNALGVYADSNLDDDFSHPKVETLAEHIKRKHFNMSVGVVTTAEVQDATPAAIWAHTRRRSEKAAITSQAINGCGDCVTTVFPDVLMGGGGKYFLPEDSIDGSNMYDNYTAVGYTVTHTKEEMLRAADDPSTEKLLTISHFENMEVYLDRNVYTENLDDPYNSPKGDGVAPTGQPNMLEMVQSAVKILSRNENGFFLMVEAASIDKSAHPLDIPRTLSDLIEMDNTVGWMSEWAKENGDETLLIVTADHGHGFDVMGTVDTKLYDDAVEATEKKPVKDYDNYCSNVTDLNGKVFGTPLENETKVPLRESNRARRKSFGIYADAGYPDYEDKDGDFFPDTWEVRTTLLSSMNNFPDHTNDYKVSKSIKEPAVETEDDGAVNNEEDDPNGIYFSGNLPPSSSAGVHTMQDVGIFASGPGSDMVRGMMDNTNIFHIMASALGVGMNGTREDSVSGVTRCIHDDKICHCDRDDMCLCRLNSSGLYVPKNTRICELDADEPVEETADKSTAGEVFETSMEPTS